MEQPRDPLVQPIGQPIEIQYQLLTQDGQQVLIQAKDLAAMVKQTHRSLRPFIEAKAIE